MSTELKHIKSKITWISAVIYVLFVAIAGRLFYVSLIMGPELREISQERLIERREIPAKRGDIYSSDGKTLATTKPVYTVHFDPITVDETCSKKKLGRWRHNWPNSILPAMLPNGRITCAPNAIRKTATYFLPKI
jgi:cell division protein FtsI/penicillin-binding protein 2